METPIKLELDLSQPKEANRLFVRIATSYWKSNRGLHQRKDILILKKRSDSEAVYGWGEDIDGAGPDLVYQQIINLDKCRDGVYELDITNVKRDWETGYVDDYDYILKPV